METLFGLMVYTAIAALFIGAGAISASKGRYLAGIASLTFPADVAASTASHNTKITSGACCTRVTPVQDVRSRGCCLAYGEGTRASGTTGSRGRTSRRR